MKLLSSIGSNLGNALSNPHVALPLVGAAVLQVAAIWFPKYKVQIDETRHILTYYGIIAAANSAPQPKDTPHVS